MEEQIDPEGGDRNGGEIFLWDFLIGSVALTPNVTGI